MERSGGSGGEITTRGVSQPFRLISRRQPIPRPGLLWLTQIGERIVRKHAPFLPGRIQDGGHELHLTADRGGLNLAQSLIAPPGKNLRRKIRHMICGNRIAPEISDFEYLPTLAAPGWRNLSRISFGDITKGAMIDRRRSRFGDRAFLPRCPFLGSLLRRKCLRGPLAFTKDLCPDGSRVELSEPCLNHPLRTGVFRASHEGLNWSDWQTRSGKLARSGRKLPLFYCTGGKPGKVMVRMVGLEPTLLAETEFESVASTIPPHPQRTEPAWQRQDQDPAGGHRFADWSPGRYARVASPAAALMASMRGGRQGSWRFNPGIRAMFAPRAWMKSDRTAFGGPRLYRSCRTERVA